MIDTQTHTQTQASDTSRDYYVKLKRRPSLLISEGFFLFVFSNSKLSICGLTSGGTGGTQVSQIVLVLVTDSFGI